MKPSFSLSLVLILLMSGCSSSNEDYAASKAYNYGAEEAPMMVASMAPGFDDGEANKLPDNRKIIYTADISVVVEDFDPVEAAVASLVKKHGGFVADSNIDTKNKKRRRGQGLRIGFPMRGKVRSNGLRTVCRTLPCGLSPTRS